MNFNPQFSNAMAVDACGARVSPGHRPARGRARRAGRRRFEGRIGKGPFASFAFQPLHAMFKLSPRRFTKRGMRQARSV